MMQSFSGNSLHVLRMDDLQAKTGQSRSSLYELQNPRSQRFDPTFPKKRFLGARSVGWFEHEVDEWLLDRQVASNFDGGNQRGVKK